jgi:hypothetical protein
MIIVKLTGGLGNQLFQYAHGKALAVKAGEKLGLDISWYKGRLDRTYLLDNFTIDAQTVGWIRTIFNRPIIGDFQSENYFKEIEPVIRKEFTLKKPSLPPITDPNSVSIHLRGTDYVTGKKSGFHGTCSPEYYAEAIKLIREKMPEAHFYIFTDDVPWAQKHLQFPEPHTIVSGPAREPYEELMLMSSCKHNIIANSTYSWWAAWLNSNKSKTVIAPKKWFADEKADSSDIIPSSWTSL